MKEPRINKILRKLIEYGLITPKEGAGMYQALEIYTGQIPASHSGRTFQEATKKLFDVE